MSLLSKLPFLLLSLFVPSLWFVARVAVVIVALVVVDVVVVDFLLLIYFVAPLFPLVLLSLTVPLVVVVVISSSSSSSSSVSAVRSHQKLQFSVSASSPALDDDTRRTGVISDDINDVTTTSQPSLPRSHSTAPADLTS